MIPADVTPIADYQAQLLEKLIGQYKDSTKLITLLTASSSGFDNLEGAITELRDNFFLDTAEGVQLDIIGSIFRVLRFGDNDTDYRARIRLQAASRLSGTPEEIISILKASYGATYVHYTPVYPAGFTIFTDATISSSELEAITPAGVKVVFNDYLVDANDNFIVTATGDNILVIGGN